MLLRNLRSAINQVTKKWIANAIIVHILLLGSIFVIYFRSPVILGLEPQESLKSAGLEPPAKRLVLMVMDGLRAESFFKANCSDIPHLRSLMLQEGLVGISRTRVPTESRPGHIAIIAGLYEDPSAVTRGWKNNPIDFDTVFNRSAETYAWGANDVLHLFSRLGDGRRLFFDAYDDDLDFSGRDKTYELDEWVFQRVRLVLKRKGESLRDKEQLVFFLHLLGLDTAGHIHKPGSPLFLENLHATDRGIWEIYHEFERTFPDNRTAYLLTSDHGMTDAGSHGSGDPHETETPFFLWGSGIPRNAPNFGRTFQVGMDSKQTLHELEQAQLTPLMSALIGLPPPMNNFGTLPRGFLKVTAEYEAHAAYTNALQLLAQFQSLLYEHQRGLLAPYLRSYGRLDQEKITLYKLAMLRYFEDHEFEAAMITSYSIMHAALEGIDYYHGYYRNALLFSTTATFIGWFIYLLQLLVDRSSSTPSRSSSGILMMFLAVIGILLVAIFLLQQVPIVTAFYLILPVLVWMLIAEQLPTLFFNKMPGITVPIQLVGLIFCAELLVFSFFERKLISLGFLLFAFVINVRAFMSRDFKFYIWLLMVMVLAIFPLLPPTVGYTNAPLWLLGIALTLLRSFAVKTSMSRSAKAVTAICFSNALLCVYQHSNQIGVSVISLGISWSFLIYSICGIFLNPTTRLKVRVELIFFNLTSLYAYLCTSYEAIFIVLLATELVLSISTHDKHMMPTQLESSTARSKAYQLQTSFRIAFSILLYTFFSFFGTGNVASISSFDPNIIRCFLTTFSPFLIMALVILKLVLPVVLNIAIIFGMSAFARINERQIFICVLLICDIMGLNFLFLVRNQGSWLEIGSSISHFVIMESTTLVLLLLTGLAKWFLKLNFTTVSSLKAK